MGLNSPHEATMVIQKSILRMSPLLLLAAGFLAPQKLPAADDTYLDALVNIGTTLGDDGLYYFNLATLIRSAATQPVKDALAKKAPDTVWTMLRNLPIVQRYNQMSDPDKATLKQLLAQLRDAVLPIAKPILEGAATIEQWVGEQSTGLDVFSALDDDNPEGQGGVADLHKTVVVFLKTTPADAFAMAITGRPPRFAANLLKYYAR
jgi:hypothetical protein